MQPPITPPSGGIFGSGLASPEQRAEQRKKQRAKLNAQARRRQKWRFALLGALGAFVMAVLLEGGFALTEVGRYFYDNAANVVMFRHSVERTTRANLGTGDVQLTLHWQGPNDLDLHCVDPYGQRLYFSNRQVESGGRLDFDMNAEGPPWSQDSVENIFWPYGTAPEGDYTVYVHHWRRHGGPLEVPYQLRILHRGIIEWQRGIAVFRIPDNADPRRDTVNSLNPMDVPAAFHFHIDTPPSTLRPVQWIAIGVAALWMALVAGGIAAALLDGLNRWYEVRKGAPLLPAAATRRLAVRALLWGACHGALTQIAFGLMAAGIPVWLEVWRLTAWTVIAACVGGRCARIIPEHLPVGHARKGGIWGGLVGGWGFAVLTVGGADSLFYGADAPGRLVAALLIGACIGWQIQLPVFDGLGELEEEVREEVPAVMPLLSEMSLPVGESTVPSHTPFDFLPVVPPHHDLPVLTVPAETPEERDAPHFALVHNHEPVELDVADDAAQYEPPVLVAEPVGWAKEPEPLREEAPPVVVQVVPPQEVVLPNQVALPKPVTRGEFRVVRSQNGRQLGGRAMGGPRRRTGGRHVQIGHEPPPHDDA